MPNTSEPAVHVQRKMTAVVPPELFKALHERASKEDRSSSSLIRQALRRYLEAEPDA